MTAAGCGYVAPRAYVYTYIHIYSRERESLKMSTSFFLVMVDRRQRRSALCQHYNLHTQSRRKVFYLTHFPMAPDDEYKNLLLTFWLVFIIQNVSYFFFCLFGYMEKYKTQDRYRPRARRSRSWRMYRGTGLWSDLPSTRDRNQSSSPLDPQPIWLAAFVSSGIARLVMSSMQKCK